MPAVTDVLRCPSCSSSSFVREPHRLLCSACQFVAPLNGAGFYRTAPTKTEQAQSLLEHQELDFYTNSTFKTFTLRRGSQALKEAIAPLHPGVWVDIGCGTGGHALTFASSYGMYVGLDPSDVPEGLRRTAPFPENTIFVQHDSEKPMPVADQSVDLVSFIASYDHIPNRPDVLRDSWRILKPGGHLLIELTNYGFWLKRLVNAVSREQKFTHAHDHFCVHDPDTLLAEVRDAVPSAKLAYKMASWRHVPNLPKRAARIYRSQAMLETLDQSLGWLFTRALRRDDLGAEMLLLFSK